MFLVDKIKGNKVTPKQRFQNAVHTVVFLRRTYHKSGDLVAQAKLALMLPPRKRSDQDNEKVFRLMNCFRYFNELKQKHGNQMIKMFCESLYYRRFEQGSEIIKIHTDGRTFYVIMTGSVGVYIYQPRARKTIIINPKQLEHRNYENPDHFIKVEINVLGIGDSFGELSLIESGSKTTATVIAKEDCELACIDKQKYWEIIGKIQQTELYDKIHFLKILPFLNDWMDQDLKTLSYHFKHLKFERLQKLYEIGYQANGIYFVREGQIGLWAKITKPPKQTVFDECEEMKIDNSKQNEMILISILTTGDIFGEEEFCNFSQRQYTAICHSETADIYKINKVDLERRLWDESRNSLIELVANLQRWRQNRIEKLSKKEYKMVEEQEVDIPLIQRTLKKRKWGSATDQSNENKFLIKKNTVIPKSDRVSKIDQKAQIGVDFLVAEKHLSKFNFASKELLKQIQSRTRKKNQQFAKLDVFERAKLLGLRDLSRGFTYKQIINKEQTEHFQSTLKIIREKYLDEDDIKQIKSLASFHTNIQTYLQSKSNFGSQRILESNQESERQSYMKRASHSSKSSQFLIDTNFVTNINYSQKKIDIGPQTSRQDTDVSREKTSPQHKQRHSATFLENKITLKRIQNDKQTYVDF